MNSTTFVASAIQAVATTAVINNVSFYEVQCNQDLWPEVVGNMAANGWDRIVIEANRTLIQRVDLVHLDPTKIALATEPSDMPAASDVGIISSDRATARLAEDMGSRLAYVLASSELLPLQQYKGCESGGGVYTIMRREIFSALGFSITRVCEARTVNLTTSQVSAYNDYLALGLLGIQIRYVVRSGLFSC